MITDYCHGWQVDSHHKFSHLAGCDRRLCLLDRLCRTARPPLDATEFGRDVHAIREIADAIAPPAESFVIAAHLHRLYDDAADAREVAR